jgi:hypothetical protein
MKRKEFDFDFPAAQQIKQSFKAVVVSCCQFYLAQVFIMEDVIDL